MTLMSEALVQVRAYKRDQLNECHREKLEEGSSDLNISDKNKRLFAQRITNSAEDGFDRAVELYLKSAFDENQVDKKVIEKFENDLFDHLLLTTRKFVTTYRW